MQQIMKTKSLQKLLLGVRLFLLSAVISNSAVAQASSNKTDTSKNNFNFPHYIQPYIGLFGDLNAEGSSAKLTNAGLCAGAHLDFWRFHCTANVYRYNKLKNDIGFLDNVFNYDLKGSVVVTKSKDLGLSLIGTYDFGNRPMVLEQNKDKGGALISTETGLPVLKEESEKYFLTTTQSYYGLGFGLLIKNKRIKKDITLCEISLRYLFVDKTTFGTSNAIELSPYNINVPQQYLSDGLKARNRGLMFQIALDKGFAGGSLLMGTRPVLYADNIRNEKLKPIESSLLIRLSIHFKIL